MFMMEIKDPIFDFLLVHKMDSVDLCMLRRKRTPLFSVRAKILFTCVIEFHMNCNKKGCQAVVLQLSNNDKFSPHLIRHTL